MSSRTPFIGQGATYAIGTDRHPVTICRVEEGGIRVGVRFDLTKGPGLFNPADAGLEAERWFRLTPAGTFRLEGRRFGQLEIGRRDCYRDPTIEELR